MYKKEIIVKNYNNKYIFFKCDGEKIAPYKRNKINSFLIKIKIGLKINAEILKENVKGEKIISLKKYTNKKLYEEFILKKKNKEAIFGRVVKESKSGYKVEYKNIFCFVPRSFFKRKGKNVLGKRFSFKICKIKRNFSIILSRDKFCKKKRSISLDKILRNRKKTILPVEITAITKYGVFSRCNKIIGLIKIRKFLLRERKTRIGNFVFAKIVRHNNSNDRIVFSKLDYLNLAFFKAFKKMRNKFNFLIFKKRSHCIKSLKLVRKMFYIKRKMAIKREEMKVIPPIINFVRNPHFEIKRRYPKKKKMICRRYKKIGRINFIILPFISFGIFKS
ncbi:30S ribosomal subunit protein S1 [Candidatus Vidania fulgoroideae]|nr:30S ribosomal subunit protein S1 [Candidatus Vidania fulgoroideae]